MAYILPTILLWAVVCRAISRSQWRAYYPLLLFTALLGTICDLCGFTFKQWVYYGPVVGGLSLWSDLGIAPAEGALFIRFFPTACPNGARLGYLLVWALLNAVFEWFYVWMGWIGYIYWNPFRAFWFYVGFFGLVWLEEYWYNGTGRLVRM
jgi:hypothetical protein